MVIEWLKFKVTPELRENFIQQDEAIWTATLSQQPGFVVKEVWLNPTVTDEVVFAIRWQSREQWKAISLELLQDTEAKFAKAIGKDNYQMIESKEYQIRKFSKIDK